MRLTGYRGFGVALLLACSALAAPALAQTVYPTAAGSNVRVPGTVPLQCNASGAACAPVTAANPLQVSGAPSAGATSGVAALATTAAAANLVAKASAGNLYGYNVTSGAAAGYVLVFNATSAPVDGAVTPLRCIPLAANTGLEVQLPTPIYFATGITVSFSTTGCFTKTASATAFIAADVK